MLKQRIITALILAPLTVWGIWALSSPLFALILALIFSLGGWEWARLSGLQHTSGRLLYAALLGGMMYGTYLLLQQESWAAVILVLALMWWTLALMSVLGYPQSSGLWRLAFARGVAGIFILLPAWAAMVLLHREFGPGYVILLIMLVWGADIGAYFAGRAFGKHKLAPRVSPGKTREGVLGGMLLALAVALVAALWLKPAGNITAFLLLCVLTVAISVLGDLVESLFKRIADVKDSGDLLPGHGGVMDRIDSLTAAAPIFTLGLVWLSR
ncbi:MAG: phosphatidate cytidylyltransferase [Gammaproteobacteria bacterium]|nr:phosphatidate cytidylyltransferase [Gammaproteobacteria bacterium]MCW8840686.1 phosphatidate cytidylyltransferase [Gammaproteobacteria bacterium]MCW8927671.1 phosphatidate cytidylyltransferase [Gammaproteobacteria bacterium]MCW8959051.1 phosphatidate cytidylyltransferase [Gammaproteobacteria bacterium]MCW8973142.1 phosphatidate cytidylyltransferase [Gammaproteobacteria bacterium]